MLQNAVEIGSTLGIERIVIDSFSLRGENKELGIAVIMPTKDQELEFTALGIGRVALLKSRMLMFPDSSIQYEKMDLDGDDVVVSNLKIVNGNTKVGFKCHDPKLINAPKAIKDPVHYTMTLTTSDVETVIKGISTMSAENINFSTDDDDVFVKISDSQGDMFSHKLQSSVERESDEVGSLSKTYKSKTLRTIFTNYIRKDDNKVLPISITRRGVMCITVLDMTIYLFPER